MASLIYNSCIDDQARGLIDFDTDAFKSLLVTADYVANKDTHTKRSDITNEVTGGTYPAGGWTTLASVTKDTVNDRITIEIGSIDESNQTFAGAAGIVVYKARGGASSADELVCFVDFGSPLSPSAVDFVVADSIITFQN